MKKKIPKFKSESEERLFWQKHDSSEYIDWSDAEDVVMPKLKPSTRSIFELMLIYIAICVLPCYMYSQQNK